jgi:hypothetical protein
MSNCRHHLQGVDCPPEAAATQHRRLAVEIVGTDRSAAALALRIRARQRHRSGSAPTPRGPGVWSSGLTG